MLDNGADVDATNDDGLSGLHLSCNSGLDAIVELLIEKHADVNKSDKNGDSPLLCACRGATEPEKNTEPYFNVCKRWLDNGAHVDATNDEGHWGLHLACYSGLDAIVELLIAKQADVNKSDKNGDSPFLCACDRATEPGNNIQLHFFVCERAFDINNGMTALMIAVCYNDNSGKNQKVVKKLCKLGACIDSRDEEGMTALMHATRECDTGMVELLIELGGIAQSAG